MRLPDASTLGARPTPQPRQAVVGYDGGALAQAMESVGREGSQLAEELHRTEQAKQRADAGLALAKMTNAMHDAHDEVGQGLSDGTVPPDQAVGVFQKRIGDIQQQGIAGLTPEQRRAIADNLELTSGGLQRSLQGAVVKRNQSDIAGTIDQFVEQSMRDVSRVGPKWASDKAAAFIDFNGPAAGIPPAKLAQLKQSTKEKAYYTYFDDAGTQALMRGDIPGLQKTLDAVNSKEGEALDPDRRTALSHKLFGYRTSLEAKLAQAQNKADSEQLKRENQAIELFNQAMDVSLKGQYLEPDFVKQLADAAAGTSIAGDVQALFASQKDVAGFASRPAAQRAAIIERWRSDAATKGKGINPLASKMLSAMEGIDRAAVEEAKTNPWSAAQKHGAIQDAEVYDASNPLAAVLIPDKRAAEQGAVEAYVGRKVSPYQPAEVEQMVKSLRSMTAADAGNWLSAIGGKLNDRDRVMAVANQLGEKDDSLALMLKAGPQMTSAGRTLAEVIRQGKLAIDDKRVKVDDQALTGWTYEFSKAIRGKIGDAELENDIIRSAFYVRAAAEADAGTNLPGFYLQKTPQDILRFVYGLPVERAGVQTFLPRGMTESAFNDQLRRITPEMLNAVAPEFFARGKRRLNAAALSHRLPELGMIKDGQGAYTPVIDGAAVTVDEAGTRPLKLRINP